MRLVRLIALLFVHAASAHAQPLPPPRVALGFTAGTTAGMSLRLPARGLTSAVAMLGVDGNDTPVLRLRAQREIPMSGSPLHGLLAGGAYAGGPVPPDPRGWTGGLSFAAGVGFYRSRFDVALEALPTVRLVGGREAWLDAAFTLRVALF